MLETRFKDLAGTIEARIDDGTYSGRLPSIRQLAEDYGVAPATIQRAVTELAIRGVVVPMGPKGVQIRSREARRPGTRMVSVFCNRLNPDLSRDILLQSLREKIAGDHWRCTFMNMPGEVVSEEFLWINPSFEGYIFLYSSITQELAALLNRHGVAFVAANRTPERWGVSCTDFDLIGRLGQAVGKAAAGGARKIGINLPHLKLANVAEELERALLDSAPAGVELRFYHTELGGIENAEWNCRSYVERYMSEPFRPDCVILLSLPPAVMRAEINARGDAELRRAGIIGVIDPEQFPAGEETVIPISYRTLADTAWQLFRDKIDHPGAACRQILI